MLRIYNIKRELELIGEAWIVLGARAICIHYEDQILISIPAIEKFDADEERMQVPLVFDGESYTFSVLGIDDNHLQTRLLADAKLFHALLRREYEITVMADELVLQQDKLLALYELNHSLRFQTKIQQILHVTAKQTQQITLSDHVFVLYDTGEIPNLAQIGDYHVDMEQIFVWYQQMLNLNHKILRLDRETGGANILLLPMEAEGRIIGSLGLVNSSRDFDMPTLKLAVAISEQACTHIQKAFFYQGRIEQERISAEMRLARDVQTSLLPKIPQAVPSLDIWAICNPAQEVGGDFYEFSNRQNVLHFSLGDVAGKGLSAALLMAISRTVLRVLSEESPHKVLERFSEHLYEDFSQVHSFVTMFTGSYELDKHILHYSNAGHAPVIYCPANGDAKMLEADCPPIGVLPEIMSKEHLIEFKLGDIFVVSSDGIPEASHLMGTMFGYENMMRLIELYRDRSAKEIGGMLLTTANIHQIPNDDQTIIVIKRVK